MYFGNLGIYVPRSNAFGNHPTLSDNLFSYYRLEETATPVGSARRDTHQSRDLAVAGGPASSVTGKNGLAFRTSSSPVVSLTRTLSDFSLAAGQTVTVSMWVSSSVAVGNGQTLARTQTPSGWRVFIASGGASVDAVLTSTTDSTTASSTNFAHDATFHHILATFNGANRTASISVDNETIITSSATTGVALQNGTVFALGPGVSPSLLTIDEVAVWGRALTLDERGALYNNGTGLFY